jgi:hypothetical protein
VLALVANRISEPASKLGCDRWLERAHHERFHAVELQHLYRACDLFAECKDELELALWDRRRTLLEQELELVEAPWVFWRLPNQAPSWGKETLRSWQR